MKDRELAEQIVAAYDSYEQFENVATRGVGNWEIERAEELTDRVAEVCDAVEAVCRERCRALLYVDPAARLVDIVLDNEVGAIGSNWQQCSLADGLASLQELIGRGYEKGHHWAPRY